MENQDIMKPTGSAVTTTGQQNPWMDSPEDKDDIMFPRAKMVQGNPTEFEQYPDAKPGQIINHLTGEQLPEKFIPFIKFRNYIKFNARNRNDADFDANYEPGAIIWHLTDPNDPRVQECKFGENGEKPTATAFLNFMALFEGQDFPVIISFSRTSYKAGKKLLSILAATGGKMNKKFKIVTKKESKDGQTYYVYDIAPAGVATEEETAKTTALYNQLHSKARDLKIADEDVKAVDPDAEEAKTQWSE